MKYKIFYEYVDRDHSNGAWASNIGIECKEINAKTDGEALKKARKMQEHYISGDVYLQKIIREDGKVIYDLTSDIC